MRQAFVDALCQAAAADDRVFLLCGDLGYSVLETFATRFPDRFVNVGVAEQNMMGVAAGLAMSGYQVWTYSIANFPVMRCLEQVRNDVCYHNLDVKIVAVGAGLAYGGHGYSHHGIEDLAVMRVMPHMTVLAPCDPVEARLATAAMLRHEGPCYMRLGKSGEPTVHAQVPHFQIGKALTLREGHGVTLIASGGVVQLTLEAASRLDARGTSAAVMSMPTVQPIDAGAIVAQARLTGRIVTVEEHGTGGIGSAVAEVLARSGVPCRFMPVDLARVPASIAGSQEYLRTLQGVSRASVEEAALSLLA